MDYIIETMGNLIHQTAFFNLTWGNYVMILVACFFIYLAIGRGYEPLLLLPISFGMLLVNLYPDIMLTVEESSNGIGGLLHYFYLLDEWAILPSLIFLGVGAMTDFGPLIANPISFILGAAAQFGVFFAYIAAILMGFSDKAAAAISIIGGADGPTSIFLAGKLGQGGSDGSNCCGRLLLYGSRTNHSTADYEAVDNKEGTGNQNGAAPSGIKIRKNSISDYRYHCCCFDSADDGAAGRYADARKSFQRIRRGKAADRDGLKCLDVYCCYYSRNKRWRHNQCRSIH